MQYKNSPEIFSRSLAAGILVETRLVSNALEPYSKVTIDFIENMDKLFDTFNSPRRLTSKNVNWPFEETKAKEDRLKCMHYLFYKLNYNYQKRAYLCY